MNFKKLFDAQEQLDADIAEHHPVQEGEDRLSKKVLALLVELGECCQEWRGFKFWSNDQKARTKIEHLCVTCEGRGFYSECYDPDELDEFETCINCNGVGKIGQSNPLLEEYVDCLHFILSIGNDLYFDEIFDWDILQSDEINVVERFENVFKAVLDLSKSKEIYDFMTLFEEFYILGQLLGFTWEQVEKAYYEKNKTNFERQKNGY